MGISAHKKLPNSDSPPESYQARSMPNAAWAWEFLRRNPDYTRDFRAARHKPILTIKLRTGATLLRPRKRHLKAEKWGLLHFADPEKVALSADVFWRPDVLAGTLNVRLSTIYENDNGDDEDHDIIVLSAIKSRRVILDATDGVRHILLNGERFWIQLRCQPPLPVGEQASVKIHIDGAAHARRKLDTAAQLLALHRSAGGQLSLIGRNRNAEPLRRALIAYDIWNGFGCERGGYRQIAEAIFGCEKVAEDWSHPSRCLKDQARRAKTKGTQLVAGGYRALLSKKAI